MASEDVQRLLRFLSLDAKVPLTLAMTKVKELKEASLMTPEAFASADPKSYQSIFGEERYAKQAHNAAKRLNKKRSATADDENTTAVAAATSPSKKKAKSSSAGQQTPSPAELEQSLELPSSDLSEEELSQVLVFTNRAPLVLAFAVTLLKYTMPHQPLSSRLSLAQAYVSISSRSRAVSLGIEQGASADEDGWGSGQPVVRVMGKDIRVMRRSDWEDQSQSSNSASTQETIKGNDEEASQKGREPPVWGLDLEALRSSNLSSARSGHSSNSMPIYTPQSARSYLLKAAAPLPPKNDETSSKRRSGMSKADQTESNLGMLLKTIEILYDSWLPSVGVAGLEDRTWGWYAQVRPSIADGRRGWGAKNEVKLGDILALKKKT